MDHTLILINGHISGFVIIILEGSLDPRARGEAVSRALASGVKGHIIYKSGSGKMEKGFGGDLDVSQVAWVLLITYRSMTKLAMTLGQPVGLD